MKKKIVTQTYIYIYMTKLLFLKYIFSPVGNPFTSYFSASFLSLVASTAAKAPEIWQSQEKKGNLRF